jgi:hypothetical protein
MNKVMILVSTMCITLVTIKSGYSQDSTKQLLHLPKIVTLGGYVAPEIEFGQLKNSFTTFGGMSGMVLFNKTFGVGVTMQRSLDRSLSPSSVSPLYLNASFGGLKMEYTIIPNSILHCTFNLMAGSGHASLDSNKNRMGNKDEHGGMMHNGFEPKGINAQYYIIQLGITVEANVVRFVKVFAGAKYRFAMQGDHSNNLLPTNTLQGFSASVGVKLGLFDYKLGKKNKE